MLGKNKHLTFLVWFGTFNVEADLDTLIVFLCFVDLIIIYDRHGKSEKIDKNGDSKFFSLFSDVSLISKRLTLLNGP